MIPVDRDEAEALSALVAAWLAIPLTSPRSSRTGTGPDAASDAVLGPSLAAVAAWVASWSSHHDPDADGQPAVDGLPLDTYLTTALQTSRICEAVTPQGTDFDEVVVLGASSTGIWRRLAYVERHRVSAPTVTLIVRRRPHLGRDGDGRDGDVEDLLGRAGRLPAAPGWWPPDDLGPRTAAGPTDVPDGWRRAAALFPDETALALLLLDRRWPSGPSHARPVPTTMLADGRVVDDVTKSADGWIERAGVSGTLGASSSRRTMRRSSGRWLAVYVPMPPTVGGSKSLAMGHCATTSPDSSLRRACRTESN